MIEYRAEIPDELFGLVYQDDLSAYFFGSLEVGFCQPLFTTENQARQFATKESVSLQVVFLQNRSEIRNYVEHAKRGGHVFHSNQMVAFDPNGPESKNHARCWKKDFLAGLIRPETK